MPFPPPPLTDLTSAVCSLRSAYQGALLWADEVRQDTEQRLGIGPGPVLPTGGAPQPPGLPSGGTPLPGPARSGDVPMGPGVAE